MIASCEFVRECFDRFNEQIFEGSLPAIPVKMVKARSFLGKLCYTSTRKGFLGFVVDHGNFCLKISVSFDLSREELEDVIIHEMIHYYLDINGRRDRTAHGPLFRSTMEKINREHGRHISIRYKSSQSIPVRKGPYYFCVSTFKDGHQGLTVCSLAKVNELNRRLPYYYPLSGRAWYQSSDPFFATYPQSRSPKIYKVDSGVLEEHMAFAVSLKL